MRYTQIRNAVVYIFLNNVTIFTTIGHKIHYFLSLTVIRFCALSETIYDLDSITKSLAVHAIVYVTIVFHLDNQFAYHF